MPGGNAFLKRQELLILEYRQREERVTRQLMADSMAVMLNEVFGFGYDRAKLATDECLARYEKYRPALLGLPESDYVQEKLDADLRTVIKDKAEFVPFEERYPEIRKMTYQGKKGK